MTRAQNLSATARAGPTGTNRNLLERSGGHKKGHGDPREPVSDGGLSCFLDPLEYTRCEVIL